MRTTLWICGMVIVAGVCGPRPAQSADPDPAVLQAEQARVAVMDKAKDAVLAVFASDGGGGGSGVVISPDGFALTNFHVVQPCGAAMKCGMADGKAYDAVLVGIDPTGDVALIKLVGRTDFPAAAIGNSDEMRTGDICFAMGNPFLLASDYQPTVTYGIVSGSHRYQPPSGTILEYTDCLQTDASINPGNSGGPLFDAQGRLIGINGRGSFEKRGRVNVGVAYAISINQIKNFLGCLHSGRILDHATLGATVAFDEDGRVIVNDILEESDAFRRSLREGDELISFGGRPITTPNAFKNVLGIYPKSWRVPLSFRREGKRFDVFVRLAGLHGKEELLSKVQGRPQGQPIPMPIPKDKKEGEEDKDGKPDFQPPKPADTKPADAKPAEEKPDGEKPADLKPIEVKPVEGKPEEGKPKGEMPKIQPMAFPGKPPIPDVIKPLFEEKHGFANYYFNRQERDRVWKAYAAKCNLAGMDGPWTLPGELDGGGEFQLTLGASDAVLKLRTLESKWDNTGGLTASLNPPHSGGLLPALHLWRRMNLEGPEKFGEVLYLGAFPVAGREGLADVLSATYEGVECLFYFDPADGLLLAMEMFPEEGDDPCELYFSEYRDVQGRQIPARLEARYGNDVFAVFKFGEVKFEKVASSKGSEP